MAKIILMLFCLSSGLLYAQVKQPDKIKAKSPKGVASKSNKKGKKQAATTTSTNDTKKVKKAVSTDTSSVVIYLEDQRAYQSIGIDENGVLKIKEWPVDRASLIFPDKDFMKYSVQINTGENSVVLAFDCGKATNCKQIALSDIEEGRLSLDFKEKVLANAGRTPVLLKLDNVPYIRLITNAADSKNTEPSTSPANIYSVLSRQKGQPSRAIGEDGVLDPDRFFMKKDKTDSCKDALKHMPGCCHPELVKNLYSQRFLKPCGIDEAGKKDNAVSLKYVMLFDATEGTSISSSKITYLELKNNGRYEYYKVRKRLSPQAYREMQINILCNVDSNYNISRDDGTNLFVDGADQFQEALSLTSKNPVLKNIDTALDKTSDKNENKTDSLLIQQVGAHFNRLDSSVAELNGTRRFQPDGLEDSLGRASKMLSADFYNINVAVASEEKINMFLKTIRKTPFIPAVIAPVLDSAISSPLYDKHLIASLAAQYVMSAKDYNKHYKNKKDSVAAKNAINAAQNAMDELIAYGYEQYVKDVRDHLLSLSMAMKNFNNHYYVLNDNVLDWARDITSLRDSIMNVFKIPVTKNADDLARSLVRRIHDDPWISHLYYADFEDIIRTIANQYSTISNKKPTLKLVGKAIDIPNSDIFNIKINEANREARNVLNRNFLVSGGLQIDFSSGFFITGIRNDEFSILPVKFSYRDAAGNQLDTIGKFIEKKRNPYSYGTGFMLHAYTRTGHYYNAGLATGVVFNGSSTSNNFQLLIGGSCMVNTRLTRIALSTGLCFGKETGLTEFGNKYIYTSSIDNAIVRNSKAELPAFYTEDNVMTATRWKYSYFIGMTFNFASANFGKKLPLE